MKKALKLFFVFLASVLTVFIVQMVVTKLWNFIGVSWGPGNLPIEPVQQTAMLSTTFVAGVSAPIVAIAVCRQVRWILIYSICGFGMAIDVFAALVPLADLPLWFKITFILSVPLQVALGTMVGARFLVKSEVEPASS
ncbi:hypothetical protein F6455_12455 [Proteobacteria bacterium 005FR1]|nr:hypothetical protein [Proteobacteria bacterium 005FR1]